MHTQHKAMFPLNVSEQNLNTRKHNKFRVKFAKHSYYKSSAQLAWNVIGVDFNVEKKYNISHSTDKVHKKKY